MLVTNPKLDTMELLYPKRKPVGKVKIDWTHALTSGLEYLNLFDAKAVDLVMGVKPVIFGSGYQRRAGSFYAPRGRGNYIEFPKSHMPDLSNGFTLTLDLITDHEVPHTEYETNYHNGYLDTCNNLGSGIRLFYSSFTGGGIRYRKVVGGVGENIDAAMPTIVKGGHFCISLAWDKQSMLLYVNGALLGSLASTSALSPVHNLNWRVGGDFNYDTDLEASESLYRSMSVHNIALSPQAIKSLHDNPYQFLIPA